MIYSVLGVDIFPSRDYILSYLCIKVKTNVGQGLDVYTSKYNGIRLNPIRLKQLTMRTYVRYMNK